MDQVKHQICRGQGLLMLCIYFYLISLIVATVSSNISYAVGTDVTDDV